MINRVKDKNNLTIIKILSLFSIIPAQKIKITDLDVIYSFSWHKGLRQLNKTDDNFIEMTSESFHFLLSHDYGIDTLNVKRFKGTLTQKIIRSFSILALNNMGRYISFKGIFSILFEPN